MRSLSNLQTLLIPCFGLVSTLVMPHSDTMADDPQQTGWKAPLEAIKRFEERGNRLNGDREFIYREGDVPDYELKDILMGGSFPDATCTKTWVDRRHAILETFKTEVYGWSPPAAEADKIRFEVRDKDLNAMDGAATRKLVTITLINADTSKEHTIDVVVFVPNDRTTPCPAFLLICNRDKENIDPTRKVKSEFWPAEEIVARGFAAVAIHNADVEPDNPEGFRNGLRGFLDVPGDHPREEYWGTLAAWAWGASRVLDYLETDEDIDHERVAVVGHSRGGKTALWAGANDPRFAMVVSNNSGCGGAALSKRRYGETVGRINRSFPHWFCDNFSDYNENEENLPVDQHLLLATIAPRLLYVTSADEDLWADPRGEFLATKHAAKSWELHGQSGLGVETMPEVDTPVQQGSAAYHIRTGGHGLTLYDWQQFMTFAEKHWK